MPARAGEQPEAVACGLRHADPPARRGGAGFECRRRPDQKERPAAVIGGELQLLAGFQIEPVDRGGDRKRHTRMQGFRRGPEAVLAVRGFDERDARRIETETVEAMSGKMCADEARIARQDENERLLPPPLWGRVGWGVVR